MAEREELGRLIAKRWWKAGSPGQVALWDAVNDWAEGRGVQRMKAVVAVEAAVVQLAEEREPHPAEAELERLHAGLDNYVAACRAAGQDDIADELAELVGAKS